METCSVCGTPDSAEYTCQKCDEWVCEDCTVAMTYHNQVDYTCCHWCMPNELTMGECNKPKKPKAMERLTELKIDMELPIEVLVAWNHETKNWEFNGSLTGAKRRVTYISSDKFKVSDFKSKGETGWIQKEGFIEFYNEFYKLNAQAPNTGKRWKKEHFYKTKFLVPNPEVSEKVQQYLLFLGLEGFISGKPDYLDAKIIFINSEGSFSYCKRPDAINYYDPSYTIIKWEDIIEASQFIKPVRTNFDNCRITCFTAAESEAVQKKLISLGYSWDGTLVWNPNAVQDSMHYYTYSDHSIGWDEYDENAHPNFEVITAQEFLGMQQQINTIHTPLNTKTDGKAIIVQRPYPAITGGKRPEGNRVSGKASRITIGRGHISYRAVTG